MSTSVARAKAINMTLRECKQAIRSFIRQHWDDQRLASVYAFNRDGKMTYYDPCGCLIGVSLSDVLHEEDEDFQCGDHYLRAQHLAGAVEAEMAYCGLASFGERHTLLSPILRAEIKRRDRVRRDLEWVYASPQETREIAILKMASGVSYLNAGDLSALCELAEDGGQVLAEMVLNPAISGVRLRGAASAEVAL